jgi:hypothetical protein
VGGGGGVNGAPNKDKVKYANKRQLNYILPECRNCYSVDSRFPHFPLGECSRQSPLGPPKPFNCRIHIENVDINIQNRKNNLANFLAKPMINSKYICGFTVSNYLKI